MNDSATSRRPSALSAECRPVAQKIHVHDNSGHPFQVQLSRALAARGHQVLHTYMATFESPKGRLQRGPGDPPTLRIEGIDLGRPFPKYSYYRRWQQEREYGRALAAVLERERPDVFLASNTPLDMLAVAQRACARLGIRFVFWVQDLYGYAVAQLLGAKYGPAGRLVGAWYRHKERELLAASDHAIQITEDFRPFLQEAGLTAGKITTIPNWAPLDELPLRHKSNAWSRAHDLDHSFVFLYSGTMGLKHNPKLLLELAQAFRDDAQVRVVVVSEGLGADWLREAVTAAGLTNVLLLPFQPFEAMPDVLGGANVLVAMLEDSAGVFSVPSKILTYLCSGRPILLAAPMQNQAVKLITETGSGRCCPSGEPEKFVGLASTMRNDLVLVDELGKSARAAAESRFELARISRHFEAALVTSP